MAVSKILLSGLTGAVVGTAAITAGNLPTNPGVGIGIAVAIVIYFLLLAISKCRGTRPKKAHTHSEGKSAAVQNGQSEATEKAKKKKKKKPSEKKPAEAAKPKSPSPPEDEDNEEEEKEEGEKKLSKTQLRRQRIKKKKEAAEAQSEKQKEEARLKQIQDKAAKEAAKKAAQQAEANKAKKQNKRVDEDGWEVQKVKERKEKKIQPVKPDASRGQEQKTVTAAPTVPRVQDTVSVPRNLIGLVIGPQGVNVNAIKEKTGVRITTPKEDNFGPVLLEGVDEKSVKAAKAAIESLVKTGTSQITHPGYTTAKVQLADSKQVGILIGPKGVNIQKIQTELKVAIKTPERNATKYTVTVSGPKEKVKEAKDAINDLIYLGYSKITNPDFDLLEVSYPAGSFGKLIGPKGQNIKSIQGNTRCRVNIPKPDNPRYKPDTVILVGPKAKLESAKKQVLNTLVEKEYYTEDYGDPNDPNYEGPEEDYY